MIGRLFVLVLLALVATLIIRSIPDVRRYLEIRRM
jgi:hypothetical protein